MKYKGISAWIIEGVRFGFFDYVMDIILPEEKDSSTTEGRHYSLGHFGWNNCLTTINKNLAKLKRKTIKGTTK